MNIFVAKLSEGTSSEDLRTLFEQYGEVSSAKVIYDRETGMSRRFGFVEMDDSSEGQAAIDALNESEVDGRTIVVKEAEPRPPRRDFGGGGGGGRGGYGGGGGRGGYGGGGGRGGYGGGGGGRGGYGGGGGRDGGRGGYGGGGGRGRDGYGGRDGGRGRGGDDYGGGGGYRDY